MINSFKSRLFSVPKYFTKFRLPRKTSSPVNESKNRFIVYLLRGKKLNSFLFTADCLISSSPKISLVNYIDLDLPLTVISDNRIDNENELAEYLEDIVGFFDAGPIPSLLLLDPCYFFNMYLQGDSLDDIDLPSFSPHILSDTVYKVDKSNNGDIWNLSFASSSLLTGWAKCLTSTGSQCAYIGSFFYSLIDQISQTHNSFGLLDVHNSSCSLLLSSNGKLVSKYLPFGVNQYLIGSDFMANDFINRLSKSIVKLSSDNALSSPKNIYFISDQPLDSATSRFFNLCNVSDLPHILPLEDSLINHMSNKNSDLDSLYRSLLTISFVALNNTLSL